MDSPKVHQSCLTPPPTPCIIPHASEKLTIPHDKGFGLWKIGVVNAVR